MSQSQSIRFVCRSVSTQGIGSSGGTQTYNPSVNSWMKGVETIPLDSTQSTKNHTVTPKFAYPPLLPFTMISNGEGAQKGAQFSALRFPLN